MINCLLLSKILLDCRSNYDRNCRNLNLLDQDWCTYLAVIFPFKNTICPPSFLVDEKKNMTLLQDLFRWRSIVELLYLSTETFLLSANWSFQSKMQSRHESTLSMIPSPDAFIAMILRSSFIQSSKIDKISQSGLMFGIKQDQFLILNKGPHMETASIAIINICISNNNAKIKEISLLNSNMLLHQKNFIEAYTVCFLSIFLCLMLKQKFVFFEYILVPHA